MTKQRIGYIGVGLMGHGAAKNILQKGYPLTIMGHRNRAPVDDLVALGAREAKTPAEVARASDVVFLCLPSTVEVEQTIYGEGGVLEGASKGVIVVDSTTADPRSTQRIGADLAKKGIRMADAPLGRTPKEAEAGKLSTFVGGDAATVRELRPIIECYADTIIEAGVLGAGHTLKLVNNFIAIGTSAVIAEALATATKLGVDLAKLYDVVSAGGGNGKMFQMMMPWVLEGDDSHLRGPLRIAGKDMRYYTKLAESAPATAFIAQAVNQTYQLANILGHGERFMPVLPGILADLNGCKIRDLDPPQ
jgi:3-hydroxyisobutyrate dehydrogenase-like beta-hydroxyacid dehydrogenase